MKFAWRVANLATCAVRVFAVVLAEECQLVPAALVPQRPRAVLHSDAVKLVVDSNVLLVAKTFRNSFLGFGGLFSPLTE